MGPDAEAPASSTVALNGAFSTGRHRRVVIHKSLDPTGSVAADPQAEAMREDWQRALRLLDEVGTRKTFALVGLGDEEVRCLTRHREVLRVGRGALVTGEAFRAADERGKHVLRARALALTVPRTWALSHHSAAALLDLPLRQSVPERVMWVRPGPGQFRRQASYTVHRGYPGQAPSQVNGLRVVGAGHALLGVAAHQDFESLIMAADAALHRSMVTPDELHQIAKDCAGWPGVTALRRAIPMLDALCESPGESLTRIVLRLLGFEARSQVSIRVGERIYRVDFLIEGTRVVVEFDGAVKYDGAAGKAALTAEKQREDAIRAQGYEFVRLTWAILDRPAVVKQMVQQALDRQRAR